MKAAQLSGLRFGRLTVMHRGPNNQLGRSQWICQCDCGNVAIKLGVNLTAEVTRSCGCYMQESRKSIGEKTRKHSALGTKEYNSWQAMRKRCNYPAEHNYANYGGRGIQVCERWDSFGLFLQDMGHAPTALHSLDRIDVNGHYAPENCRWATAVEQCNNRRNNLRVRYMGEERTVAEWARLLGVNANMVVKRLRSNWSPERALTQKPRTTARTT